MSFFFSSVVFHPYMLMYYILTTCRTGMMAYEVVTGRVAFEQGQYHIKSVSSAILEGQRPVFEPEDYDVIPPLLIKLIKLCW